MMRIDMRAAVLAVVLNVVLALSPVVSASTTTVYVSHTGSSGAADTSCKTAAYRAVQDAVEAAPAGGTVYLCGRVPFQGPVVVEKDLTLTGDRGATLSSRDTGTADQVPASFWARRYPGLRDPHVVVAVLGGVRVRVAGLTVTGLFENQSCPAHINDFGILAIGSRRTGASVSVDGDRFVHVGSSNEPSCITLGDDLEVGRYYWPTPSGAVRTVDFVGHVEISDTTFASYQGTAVFVDGQPSSIDVAHSEFDGGGPNSVLAKSGMQISRGATGDVYDNLIEDNEYTGTKYADVEGYGVIVFGGCGAPLTKGVQIHDDTFVNDDVSVDQFEGNSACTASTTQPTYEQFDNNMIVKNTGITVTSRYTDQYGNNYSSYQTGITDTGDRDAIFDNHIFSSDGAFGPSVKPPGPFLAPIDIQSYAAIDPWVRGNTYNGRLTNPPYPGEPGAPQ